MLGRKQHMHTYTRALGVALAIAIVSASPDAHALDSYGAEYSWKPVMPLFGPGTALLLGGYVPLFAAAAPTSLRAGATLFYDVGTLGMGCDRGQPEYTCSGDYGGAQLLIPFAGPFLYADSHPKDSQLNPHGQEMSPTLRTLLYVDGAAQIAGAALMGIGLAGGEWEHDGRASTSQSKLSIAPMLGMGRVGLSLGVTGM